MDTFLTPKCPCSGLRTGIGKGAPAACRQAPLYGSHTRGLQLVPELGRLTFVTELRADKELHLHKELARPLVPGP